MDVLQGYEQWASFYDEVENKTRDLDAIATKQVLAPLSFNHVLELGCGTGKNTQWLAQNCRHITAFDFSQSMMEKAAEKLKGKNVDFIQTDITQPWPVANNTFNLVTANLVLEHIQQIDFVFGEAYKALQSGGYFFISELHPFKQYTGSKARFEKDNITTTLPFFIHHTSEYTAAAQQHHFKLEALHEWFDAEDNTQLPRLISFLFQKG